MTAARLTLIVGISLAFACAPLVAQPVRQPTRQPKDKDVETLVMGVNAFATDLYARLAVKPGNLFFSPASIDTALAMTYAGAKGPTAEQMARVLSYKLDGAKLTDTFAKLLKQINTPRKGRDDKPAYQLVIANALWGQQGFPFKQDYVALVKKTYDAGLNNVDFRQAETARKTINDWVAKQTKEKIKDLIPSGVLTRETRLVLTNAIYFKSNWLHQFKKQATKDGSFSTTADKTVTTPMMHQTERFGYLENPVFQALEMPYASNDLSMVVFLPKRVDGLAALEKTITLQNVSQWIKQLKNERVEVTLPKFKITSQFSLAKTLPEMGMVDAFNADLADFSGMTSAERLFISDVIHKAYVDVDENGTEAAAATAVIMMRTTAVVRAEQPKIFKADHPFVYVIRHRVSGTILFMGRLADPKS